MKKTSKKVAAKAEMPVEDVGSTKGSFSGVAAEESTQILPLSIDSRVEETKILVEKVNEIINHLNR